MSISDVKTDIKEKHMAMTAAICHKLKEQIAVMEAYQQGKRIFCAPKWRKQNDEQIFFETPAPDWKWHERDYKVETKSSIDWSQVHPRYKYMFTTQHGITLLSTSRPTLDGNNWLGGDDFLTADVFTSFVPGVEDFRNSLQERLTETPLHWLEVPIPYVKVT